MTASRTPGWAHPLERKFRIPSSGGTERLTPRERDVLRAFAAGARGHAGVAAQLGVATCTAATHIESARAKLGAETSEQAMYLAAKRGLID